ncbi:hypothetical protein INP83_09400 [Mucilaginibacter sp. 21P]|uniref:hypothetical protein n=1 Tax=Mucilaginibacter sp. 21P TaxID=2778902 RepID=UPI001C57D025|nr:hypothetical protein [Mucilaginibacter sp. 21P]QXV67280.1 hypothetical protein INP83_09400 [Mucilaginibacter sp. 21P]
MKKSSTQIFLIFTLFLYECTPDKFNCDSWAEGYKNNTEFNIVYKSATRNGPLIYMYGTDLKTGEFVQRYEGSGWMSEIYTNFKPGDTIIKKRREYKTTVKWKKGSMIFPVKCGGQAYVDK